MEKTLSRRADELRETIKRKREAAEGDEDRDAVLNNLARLEETVSKKRKELEVYADSDPALLTRLSTCVCVCFRPTSFPAYICIVCVRQCRTAFHTRVRTFIIGRGRLTQLCVRMYTFAYPPLRCSFGLVCFFHSYVLCLSSTHHHTEEASQLGYEGAVRWTDNVWCLEVRVMHCERPNVHVMSYVRACACGGHTPCASILRQKLCVYIRFVYVAFAELDEETIRRSRDGAEGVHEGEWVQG